MNTNDHTQLPKQANPRRVRKRYSPALLVVSGLVLSLLVVLGVLISSGFISWPHLPITWTSSARLQIDPTICGKWEIAYGPRHNLGRGDESFYDVEALADDDVWAIGYTSHRTSGHSLALMQHWDGESWRIVPSPEPGGSVGTYLSDLVAVSANDIWAVGSYFKEPSHSSEWTLTMHWDGERWGIVPSPNVGLERNSLSSITALASDDLWAVGSFEYENPDNSASTFGWRIQILHWDGKSWSIVPSPYYEVGPHADTFSNGLSNIVGVSSNNVWAVGSYLYDDKQPPYKGGPLAIHWDGREWKIVATSISNLSSGGTTIPAGSQKVVESLQLAYAVGEADIWAFGQADEETVTTHWNGTDWTITSAPILEDRQTLHDVVVLGRNDVWAVGSNNELHGIPQRTLVVHWNGSQWGRVESPNVLRHTVFSGISATPSGQIWAVGYSTDDPYEPHTIPLPRYAVASHFSRSSCPAESSTVNDTGK